MALRDIILYPNDVLATEAAAVAQVDDEVRQLIDDMIQTMYHAPGIGLAAPQVDVLSRVTVIDIHAGADDASQELRVFVNPKIVWAKGHILWEEGCLSIPGIYEKVERADKVCVQALDRQGQEFELEASGLLSVALQHEIDHLDGVVFLSHLSPLKRRLALKRYKKHLAALEQERAEGPTSTDI